MNAGKLFAIISSSIVRNFHRRGNGTGWKDAGILDRRLRSWKGKNEKGKRERSGGREKFPIIKRERSIFHTPSGGNPANEPQTALQFIIIYEREDSQPRERSDKRC